MILVALGPQSSLSVVGKPSAKRPEAVMVSVILIFDGMVLLRRSCNRSGMTRLEGLYGGVARMRVCTAWAVEACGVESSLQAVLPAVSVWLAWLKGCREAQLRNAMPPRCTGSA